MKRSTFVFVCVGMGALLMQPTRRTKAASPKSKDLQRQAMQDLIRARAITLGVPVSVALAIAEVESRFDPDAEGDKDWHIRKGGTMYRDKVLNARRFANNPWRDQPELWHSYGLFQLLAPYHAKGHENPRVLLDPDLNVVRGLTYIRELIAKHKGNLDAVRLAYTGNPSAPEVRLHILSMFAVSLKKWEAHEQA